MTRTPEQIAADQAFLAKARTRSPKFPDISEALERRQKLRETIAARTLLACIPLGIAGVLFTDEPGLGWAVAGFGLVGFVVTCFVAGNRQHVRSGGHDSGRFRSF